VPAATFLAFTPARIEQTLAGDLPNDTPVNFTASGAFGRVGPGRSLGYVEPGSGVASVAAALLLPGSGAPINSYLRGFDPKSGNALPGTPARTQGLDFLGAPVIADVSGDGVPETIEGGDSSALHAFTASGAQAPGFPKFHTGWTLFGPSVGDLDGNGRNEVATMTREGYSWCGTRRAAPIAATPSGGPTATTSGTPAGSAGILARRVSRARCV